MISLKLIIGAVTVLLKSVLEAKIIRVEFTRLKRVEFVFQCRIHVHFCKTAGVVNNRMRKASSEDVQK